MGMYTELIFGCKLKKETPSEVINDLKYYCDLSDMDESELIFKTKSGRNPLDNGGSYCFGVTNSQPQMWLDDITKSYHISTRTNLKNYEDEIEDFLNWIRPWIDQGSGEREMYAIVTYEQGMPDIHYLLSEDEV